MTAFEKTFHFFKNPWVLLSFILLTVLVYMTVDIPVAQYFYNLKTRTTWPILNVFTLLGKNLIYLGLFLVLGLYFRHLKKNKLYENRAWFLLSCVIMVTLINMVLKISFGRARPELYFINHYFGFYWFKFKDLYWSFPSGHAITSVAVASGMGIIFQRYFYTLLAVAILVICSRVILYRHYLSDVMVGFYLGVLIIGFFAQWLKKSGWLKL